MAAPSRTMAWTSRWCLPGIFWFGAGGLEWQGLTMVVSGDYTRRRDPTCAPFFEPVACDVFVSEATFGLPVFRHPDDRGEIAKLLQSLRQFPERAPI